MADLDRRPNLRLWAGHAAPRLERHGFAHTDAIPDAHANPNGISYVGDRHARAAAHVHRDTLCAPFADAPCNGNTLSSHALSHADIPAGYGYARA